jgi:UDP-N-acetylmuramoyl-tripeptide--D-alanyl-D-alanine ligase
LLIKAWKSSQPALRRPRMWVAIQLRKLLQRTTFIAITGSNGKTTATYCLAAILSEQAPTQWTRSNRNTAAGFTETIAFCNPWRTRFAIFEVGAGKPNAVEKAARLIQPDISVVLSVFLEHRGSLRNLEEITREKSQLLAGLKPDGIAVINAVDPYVAGMPVPPGRKQLRFGWSPDCDVFCEEVVSAWPQMLKFTVVAGAQRQEIHTRLLGEHWIGALLASITVAHHLGIPLESIARAIKEMPPYPGRMQVVRLPSGAVVIRDEIKGSAHTNEAAFEALRKATANRKFVVFCDESESSLGPRKRLGKIGRQVAGLADFAIFVGDQSDHGVRGARAGGLGEQNAMGFPGYMEAAQFLNSTLGEGDVILLKADRNRQLSRLFFSLVGEIGCAIPVCKVRGVCDGCTKLGNPGLVKRVNELLTVRVD